MKYSLVADRRRVRELKVLHCLTEDTIADLYTKPLQGTAFLKHRNSVQGIDPQNIPTYIKNYEDYLQTITDLDTS